MTETGDGDCSMASGELSWDVPTKNGFEVFFSKSTYEKYSMSPTLWELWQLANRPTEEKADVPAKNAEKGEEEETGHSSQPSTSVEESVKPSTVTAPFPEPRIPYPYFSCLTEKEQKIYVHLMAKYASNRKYVPLEKDKDEYSYFLNLKSAISGEIEDFLKYAQNAARRCANDYNMITADACRYAEELLNAGLGYVKNYPEFYTLSEITSIMGGKFSTDLTLKLEKCLLKLGSARFVKTSFPEKPTQLVLSTDYTTVSTFSSPEKKAAEQHKDIGSDPNIEKLAVKYCPQIVLTAQSLFTLLNNHGLNYKEQWEIPVSVKMLSVKGSKPVKVVYIDTPLPKKEMTVREKNQIFHEVPLDMQTSKTSSVSLSAIVLDKVVSEYKAEENFFDDSRKCRESENAVNNNVDFEGDVTELETFGTISDSSRKLHIEATAEIQQNLNSILSEKLRMEKHLSSTVGTEAEEAKKKCEILEQSRTTLSSSATGLSGSNATLLFKESAEIKEGDSVESEINDSMKIDNSKQATCGQSPHQKMPSCSSDTDDERLVIVTSTEKHDSCDNNKLFSPPSSVIGTSRSLSPLQISHKIQAPPTCLSPEQKKSRGKNPSKRLSKEFDPVGDILKMQEQLLKPSIRKVHEQPVANIDKSTNLAHCPAAQLLMKPYVTLPSEPGRTAVGSASSFTRTDWASQIAGAQKCFLSSELQFLTEDESEYTAPDQGNLVYKLFSLDDMLLLIRSCVHKAETRPRNNKKTFRKHYPIYVLPKVEYQAYYGVEALTESEICRLWTESLLHSNCWFYIGHIDAFTSHLLMLEEISVEGIKEKFGSFNVFPAASAPSPHSSGAVNQEKVVSGSN
uniref:Little elongation complex subunit 2 isoform X2 n=1 Tax=Geotrypetes seraphini TaxID=260995 RepID=A0A6P8PL99_GEOSA|nr:little elongation complex subunit 2 isoform X2 [Geotrypetes seraphini]